MFDRIISWLAGAWSWLGWLKDEIWRQVRGGLLSVWGFVLIAVGWLWSAVDFISSSVAAVLAKVDALVFPSVSVGMPGSLSYAASVANTFFPLQEAITMAVAFMALVLGLTVYRLIKSWIPTLS